MYNCKNVLDCLVKVAPHLNDMTLDDLAVAIADARTKTFICYVAGDTIDHGIKDGDPVAEGTVVGEALKKQTRIVKKADSKNFGFSYVGVGLPIKDENGEMIGAISLNKSLAKQEEMISMSEDLSKAVTQMTSTSETLSAESQELAAEGGELSEMANQLDKKVGETDGVLKVIKKITDQTNLLGLNASIEAARVGEQGKGFGVVAEEIRKLAENSASSLKEIEEILATLKSSKVSISEGIKNIGEISNGQADEIQEVAETIRSIESMSQKLVKFAEEMV